jgi:predicted TPR repeat methyltransferase
MTGSGDLLADRRYAWAEGALDDGDHLGAADLAGQIVAMAPDFAAGWLLLGRAEHALGHSDAAAEAFRRALALDPDDVLGAGLWLAQMGEIGALGAMTPAYVQALFDGYAVRFERHLVQSLGYRGPALLHDAVRRARSRQLRNFHFASALDLGCGTGLAGEAFRPQCVSLAGVDLSPEMVRKAARKRLYDTLDTGDAVEWLSGRPAGSADLVIAADVMIYIGDLAPVFAAAARALGEHGLFALTVQAHAGEGVVLGADARYAHGAPYLQAVSAQAGFDPVIIEDGSIRQDRGVDVPGLVLVLSKAR